MPTSFDQYQNRLVDTQNWKTILEPDETPLAVLCVTNVVSATWMAILVGLLWLLIVPGILFAIFFSWSFYGRYLVITDKRLFVVKVMGGQFVALGFLLTHEKPNQVRFAINPTGKRQNFDALIMWQQPWENIKAFKLRRSHIYVQPLSGALPIDRSFRFPFCITRPLLDFCKQKGYEIDL